MLFRKHHFKNKKCINENLNEIFTIPLKQLPSITIYNYTFFFCSKEKSLKKYITDLIN